MTHITLSEKTERPLSFYLAMEEYVARVLNVENAFFTWQVMPSVIFGRNQLIENEVNIDYCERQHIKMYRRKSGGGCVYADKSNLMLSYITTSDTVGFTFHRYMMLVTTALKALGIPATANGRNDIMIEGRKVSGNAFYHIPSSTDGQRRGRSIVHGTLLYDTKMENMLGCITPDSDKLLSKGVKSVRQHIALLKDYTTLSLEEVRQHLIRSVCDEEYLLTTADIEAIEQLEKEYLSPDFVFGRNPRYSVVRKKRLEGVGTIEARLEVKNNIIVNIELRGDYFLTGEQDVLCQSLRGVALEREQIKTALPAHLEEIIMNLDNNTFVEFLTEQNS